MKKSTIQNLAEARYQQILQQQEQLIEGWKPILNACNKWNEEHRGEPLDKHQMRNIAQCLENAYIEGSFRQHSKMFEATTEDNISFLGVQLPVIAAIVPSLVLNDVAVVQALDRRTGSVFYLDVKAGSTKGGVTSGDVLMDAKTGHARTKTNRLYAAAIVENETLVDEGGGGAATYTGTVDFAPGLINLEYVTIKDSSGTVLGRSNSSGTITDATSGSTGVTGTITAAGVYSIDFSATSLGSGNGATITYHYQYDLPTDAYGNNDGVPQMDINISSSAIESIDFPVRSRYSIGAMFDLKKAHGMDLESEVVKYLGGEVRWTVDHYGIDLIETAATGGYDPIAGANFSPATAITAWNANVGSGEPWIWKKEEFIDRIYEGSNNIQSKTLRAIGNFIIADLNVCRVISQHSKFKGNANITGKKAPTGPVNIGTLDNRFTVVQDPFLTTNRYLVGYKGDHFLNAGMIYAPYIPLFASPTLTTADLIAQKGFMSSAGFKITNAGMFTYGSISGTYFS